MTGCRPAPRAPVDRVSDIEAEQRQAFDIALPHRVWEGRT
jgi:hypothetical protein